MLDVEAAGVGQGRRQAQFGHNFAGVQGGATGGEERFGQGQPAFPAGAGDAALGIVGEQGGQGVAGGGGVADVADDGRQVANLDAGKGGGAGGQGGIAAADDGALLKVGHGGQGADGQAVVIVPLDGVEAGEVADADDGIGLPGAGTPAYQEVGAAGDEAGAGAVFGHHTQGIVQGMGFQVVKTGHRANAPQAGDGIGSDLKDGTGLAARWWASAAPAVRRPAGGIILPALAVGQRRAGNTIGFLFRWFGLRIASVRRLDSGLRRNDGLRASG